VIAALLALIASLFITDRKSDEKVARTVATVLLDSTEEPAHKDLSLYHDRLVNSLRKSGFVLVEMTVTNSATKEILFEVESGRERLASSLFPRDLKINGWNIEKRNYTGKEGQFDVFVAEGHLNGPPPITISIIVKEAEKSTTSGETGSLSKVSRLKRR